MPMYEWKCPKCNIKVATLAKVDDRHILPKPVCKCKKDYVRVISAPNLVFKGDGFYVNDYNTDK